MASTLINSNQNSLRKHRTGIGRLLDEITNGGLPMGVPPAAPAAHTRVVRPIGRPPFVISSRILLMPVGVFRREFWFEFIKVDAIENSFVYAQKRNQPRSSGKRADCFLITELLE